MLSSNALSSNKSCRDQQQTITGSSLELKLALNHLSDDFAGTTIQTSRQHRQAVYGVDCGRAHLLLGSEIACEVVSDGACCPLPNAPESLVGLHVSRGDLIPVYRIENALHGLYPAVSSSHLNREVDTVPWILLLGKGEERVGIVLQQLPQLYDITGREPVQTKANFSEVVSQFTRQTYHVDNQWWLVFDWLAFLKALSDLKVSDLKVFK
jgi:chemotaxis signal transduction protein